MTLLGASVLKSKAQDKAIQDKIDDLTRAVDRLKHLQAHDALVILKPKLLYLLRTSQCSDNPDDTLRTGLITILNVDINSDQWLQASLPVGDGGLGIRSAEMLAPSAYLASAASTLLLQQSILHDSIWMQGEQSVACMETSWTGLANSPKPSQQTHPESLGWTSCSKSKEPNPFQSSI